MSIFDKNIAAVIEAQETPDKASDKRYTVPSWAHKRTKKIITALLEEMDETVITSLDTISLDMLCQNFDIMEQASANINEYGVLVGGKKNPAVGIYKESSNVVMTILKEYGLTAKARRFLPQLAPDEKQSDLEDFFGKKKTKAIEKAVLKTQVN
jgi:P27 family predicted phage terminase small subunit